MLQVSAGRDHWPDSFHSLFIIRPYASIIPGTRLYETGTDVLGNSYGSTFVIGSLPMVPAQTYAALSDYCDDSFWAPYPH